MRNKIVLAALFAVLMLSSCNMPKENKQMNEISLLPVDGITYQNPLPIQYIGDPYILEADGKYYCFPTSAHNGFKVWESDDLVNWNIVGMAYKRNADSWSGDRYWAPEVVEHNGRYYMFYTAATLSNPTLRIGLAIADKPEGPYIDYDNKPFFDPGYAVIDASVFMDDDGRNYMYFAVDCSENIVEGRHESQVGVVELSSDLMSVISEPQILLKPSQQWEMVNGNAWAWNEGPIILKHSGLYYLFYSANCYDNRAYSVGYATSDSPMGEFTKHTEPLLWHTKPTGEKRVPLISGPGHNSFAYSPDKQELFIVYHTHMNNEKPSGERQVAIDRVYFGDDGKVYTNGPTIAPQIKPSGTGASLIKPNTAESSGSDITKLFSSSTGGTEVDGDITITLEKPQSINVIAITPKTDTELVLDIVINGTDVIKDVTVEASDIPGYCKILRFEPFDVSDMKFIIKEGNASFDNISLYHTGN